jgi:hypothetical protein
LWRAELDCELADGHIDVEHHTVEKALSGHLETGEPIVSKSLRMLVERYHSLFPHVLAAIQLRQHGQQVWLGRI